MCSGAGPPIDVFFKVFRGEPPVSGAFPRRGRRKYYLPIGTYSPSTFMWRLSARVVTAFSVEFVIHLAFFTFVSWLLGSYLELGPWGMLANGAFFAAIFIIVEWLIGPSLASSLFRPRWIERADDPVLWSMVHEEAARAGVKVRRIGVVGSEAPNALAYASITGRRYLVFTRGLLLEMTFPEVRAVACYLLGCAKSGGLPTLTTLSGLLTIPHGIAGGYIGARLGGRRPGYGSAVAAGIGYVLHALTYPQTVMVARVMSLLGDEFSIQHTGDPSSFVSALMKSVVGCALRPLDPMRARCAPLKGLMFQDPTTALREAAAMRESAERRGIALSRLVDMEGVSLPEEDRLALHAFEKFWPQAGPVGRLEHAIELGKSVRSPIKVGLSWIE